MPFLRLSRQHLNVIVQHCRDRAPQEACGLLAGIGADVQDVLPVRNSAEQPEHAYEMDVLALLQALKRIDAQGLDWIGLYHSHPASAPIPSPQDIEQAQQHTPHQVHLIVGLHGDPPRLQAWQIRDGEVAPVELLVERQRPTLSAPLTAAQRTTLVLVTVLALLLVLGIALTLLPPAPPLPSTSP